MIYSILVFIKVKGWVVFRCTEEKYDNFIGWKSSDGLLEVISVHSESKNGKPKMYKVICVECSKDKDLFPDGYFVSTKGNLEKNKKPCGCSNFPKWYDWQYLVLLNRVSTSRFKVLGFDGEFKDISTKVKCECLKDGHTWSAGISPLLKGHGCPSCGKIASKQKRKIPTEKALRRCEDVCEKEGYTSLGFPNGYTNSSSVFEYRCEEHGKQSVTFSNFTKPNGTKCPYCVGKKKMPHTFIKDILKRCSLDNYTFIGFQNGYLGNLSKISYLCPEHGLQEQRYANFMSGAGCSKCNKGVALSEQDTSKICRKICEEMDYTFIGFPNGYKSNKSKLTYSCPEHGEQLISYDNFTQGKRCKGCSKSGYDPHKKGCFYVVRWLKENDSFLKFGITNQKVKTRIKQQSNKTEYTPEFLFVATFEDGFIPLKIENFIKKQDIDRHVISKEYFADGFTETVSISDLELLEGLIVHSLTSNIGDNVE